MDNGKRSGIDGGNAKGSKGFGLCIIFGIRFSASSGPGLASLIETSVRKLNVVMSIRNEDNPG